MTRSMLELARQAGVDRIIATPHVADPAALERVHQNTEPVRALTQALGIRLYLGGEVRVSALLNASDAQLRAYRLGIDGFLLVEFQNDALPLRWEFLICDLVARGVCPIVAHPERYRYIQKDLGVAEQMISYGCELQLDAQSLTGLPLSPERRAARQLLRRGMVSYVASDAHRPEDYRDFERIRKKFADVWPKDGLLARALGAQA